MSLNFRVLLAFVAALYSIGALAQSHTLSKGWNLVGNDAGADIDPVSIFGNTASPTSVSSSVTSVWSWDTSTGRWQFFAPGLSAADLSTYANSKGYGILSTIAKGEGFWVNTSTQVALSLTSSNSGGGSSSSGFPMTFNGIRMDSMVFSSDAISCSATLTYKNVGATTSTPFLYFDIVVGGITVNQTVFYTTGLAPGSTAQGVNRITNSSAFLACGTFQLQFNTSQSHVY